MTTKALLHTAALLGNVLVKARDADKGHVYQCPACSGDMILRQGNQRRAHFVHKVLTENCTPESALHHAFKRLLAEKIEYYLSRSKPLKISWSCRYCLENHTGNLLKKAKRVAVEYNLGACRPDVALLDGNGKAIAALEVVVSHSPEQQAIDFYRKQNIALISFHVQSEESLDSDSLNPAVDQIFPDDIDACLNPTCRCCRERTNSRKLVVVQSTCRSCKTPMSVAGFLGKGSLCGTFYPADLKLIESKGVSIGYWKSRKSGFYYPTSMCPRCKTVAGLPWLWDQHIDPDLALPTETYPASHVCGSCDRDINKQKPVRYRD